MNLDKYLSSGKIAVVFLSLVVVGSIFITNKFRPNFNSNSIKKNNSSKIKSAKTSLEKKGPQIGFLAPDFITQDTTGNRVALKDFRGKKPVLLIFWATWCGFCAKELEDLKVFVQKHQDKIQVLAVVSGEPPHIIEKYIQEKNINFLILLDQERKIWDQYLVRGTPSHFLIDKEGKIVAQRPGLNLLKDLETMLRMLENNS